MSRKRRIEHRYLLSGEDHLQVHLVAQPPACDPHLTSTGSAAPGRAGSCAAADDRGNANQPHERPIAHAGPSPGSVGAMRELYEQGRLYVCFHCLGGFVYALDWVREDRGSWQLALRCPDCGARREGVFDAGAVENLEKESDQALASMLGDLRTLTRANMQEEIAVFVRALQDDLIGPSDF